MKNWKNIVLTGIIFVALMVIAGLATMFMGHTLCESVIGMIIAAICTKIDYRMYKYFLGFPKY